MPADMQMTIGSLSAHAQWCSCQNNGADYCDIIKQRHENLSCIKGREVQKGKLSQTQGSSAAAVLLSGCLDILF